MFISARIAQAARHRPLRWFASILYAGLTGCFCTWLVGFYPVDGRDALRAIPAEARTLLYAPSTVDALRALSTHPLTREISDDPDIRHYFDLHTQLVEAQARHAKLPFLVRWLVPFSFDGLGPFVGAESAIAWLPRTEGARRTPQLIVTRVAGFRGQFARIAAHYAPVAGDVECFDLGGSCIAIGLHGAKPASGPNAIPPNVAHNGSRPLLSVILRREPRHEPPLAGHPNATELVPPLFREQFASVVPGSVQAALLQPPDAFDLFGLRSASELRLELRLESDETLSAAGTLRVETPLEAPVARALGPENPFISATLPVDLRAAFLAMVVSDMQGNPGAMRLSSGQRRWIERFEILKDEGIDLDTMLWNKFHSVATLAMSDPPPELDTSGYGILSAYIPVRTDAAARTALGELVRVRWNGLFDGPPEMPVRGQYVLRHRGTNEDRYVLATGQINAPAWRLNADALTILSDAGPFALRQPERIPFPASSQSKENAEAPLFSFFADGPRLAPTVKKLATVHFDDLEEELGTQAFLEKVPDAKIQVRLWEKACSALGMLRATMTGSVQSSCTLTLAWKPSHFKMLEEEGTDAVIPPPPPPGR